MGKRLTKEMRRKKGSLVWQIRGPRSSAKKNSPAEKDESKRQNVFKGYLYKTIGFVRKLARGRRRGTKHAPVEQKKPAEHKTADGNLLKPIGSAYKLLRCRRRGTKHAPV